MHGQFKLGKGSKRKLAGYHPEHGFIAPVNPVLASVMVLGLHYSTVDFGIGKSTLRTLAEQREFVRLKRSRTLKSKHLVQDDGTVHAVDVIPYLGAKAIFRSDLLFEIAAGVQQAARELDVPVHWGGCWRPLNGEKSVEQLHADYVEWCRIRFEQGRRRSDRPFIDDPHYELPTGYLKGL